MNSWDQLFTSVNQDFVVNKWMFADDVEQRNIKEQSDIAAIWPLVELMGYCNVPVKLRPLIRLQWTYHSIDELANPLAKGRLALYCSPKINAIGTNLV